MRFIPNRFLTFVMGKLAASNNYLIKTILIKGFIQIYDPDLSLIKKENIKEFKSYNDFFIRELKANSRPIEQSENIITSPVDGTVVDFGKIIEDNLIQAKEFKYSISDLLGNVDLGAKFRNGLFVTIYLAPTDYHRIHSPYAGKIISSNHMGTSLHSVNDRAQRLIPSLYVKNERGLVVVESKKLSYALVSVGASVVGSIVPFWSKNKIKFRNDLIKQWRKGPEENQKYVKKGQEIAHFRMGSTVILLLPEANKININSLYQNKTVKFGEKLIELK
jgi:phosphatidylserine decarboxylase|tara:strand:+ start:2090 stop:2917 length:828 start_codon:yes stop_codon:yes gene_type:complete